jgi:hypothetical protein
MLSVIFYQTLSEVKKICSEQGHQKPGLGQEEIQELYRLSVEQNEVHWVKLSAGLPGEVAGWCSMTTHYLCIIYIYMYRQFMHI